jgi:hypothetical protein
MKLPKTEPTLIPMLQAIKQSSDDSALKARAFKFLRSDLSRLQTERELREAYSGLSACMQILGPQDGRYAKALTGMQKILETFTERIMLEPGLAEKLDQLWQILCGIVQKNVPPELWPRIEPKIRPLLKQLCEGAK